MATIKGTALTFGVTSSATGVNTSAAQSYSQTNGVNQKELKGRDGTVKSIAFFRKTEEVSVDFLGIPTGLTVAAALHGDLQAATNAECFIDEITIDSSNEDYVKTSVRATTYGIAL